MFRKNFIFLILPLCLQCSLFDKNKGKKDENETVDNNEISNGILKGEEYKTATVNDKNNIFSDDIKNLRIKKEEFKLKDNGKECFDSYKKKSTNDIKQKFQNKVVNTARQYFIRQLGHNEDFFKKLGDLINPEPICDVFKYYIKPGDKDKLYSEIDNLIAQYKGALSVIENEKFDS